jgi:hypothetical protein
MNDDKGCLQSPGAFLLLQVSPFKSGSRQPTPQNKKRTGSLYRKTWIPGSLDLETIPNKLIRLKRNAL